MLRRSSFLIFVLLLVLGSATDPAVVAAEAKTDSRSDADSIVPDVLRMLNGGVSAPAIVEWLNRQPTPIPVLTPDEMIDLSQAGASDELMETLNRMSRGPSAPTPPAPVPVPVPAQTTPTETPAAPPHATGEADAGVRFTLKYKRPADTGNEFDKRWTLFVYVDGIPITYSRSQSSFVDQTIETFRRITPGKHVLLLLHESHVKKGKKGWQHETQVSPDPIFFEVGTGDAWTLDLTYVVKTFSKSGQGPLTWELRQGNEPVAGRKATGQRIDDWPPLCDDMESNIPEGKSKTPSWIQKKLDGCVYWSSLSEGFEPWPERGEILAVLAEYDYKPPRD